MKAFTAKTGIGNPTTICPTTTGVMMMGLLLPAVQSFSVGNHHPQHHNPLSLDHQTTLHFSNSLVHECINTNTGRTRLPYINDDFSFCESIQFGDERAPGEPKRLALNAKNKSHPSIKQEYSSTNEVSPPPSDNAFSKNKIKRSDSVVSADASNKQLQPSKRAKTSLNDLENDARINGMGLTLSLGDSLKTFPLIIQPTDYDHPWTSSFTFLKAFLEHNRQWIQDRLLEHGTVVFRGFEVDHTKTIKSETNSRTMGDELIRAFDPGDNERTTSPSSTTTFDPWIGLEYYAVTKRKKQVRVPSSSLSPKIEEIRPDTSITDFRKIYRDLPPKLRSKLDEKKLLYQRTDERPTTERRPPKFLFKERQTRTENKDNFSFVKSWSALFGTSNTNTFERTYNRLIQEVLDNYNAGFTVSEFISDAFRAHPTTKDPIWFPFAHSFHWTSAPAEAFERFRRTKNLRELARSLGLGVQSLWNQQIRKRQQPNSTPSFEVTFGDGTPISFGEMHQIRRAVRANTVDGSLQHGDIVILDSVTMGLQS